MIQDKAQSTVNGVPLTRAVTQYWVIWGRPAGETINGHLRRCIACKGRAIHCETRLVSGGFLSR